MRYGIGLAGWLCAVSLIAAEERVTVRPSDDGRALCNPGMGWTMHYYSNAPINYGTYMKPGDSAAWFPGCSWASGWNIGPVNFTETQISNSRPSRSKR